MNSILPPLHRSRRVYPGKHTAKGSRQTHTLLQTVADHGLNRQAVGHPGNVVLTNVPEDGRADVTGL